MASSLSKLRIGLVGAGENTRQKHLPGFQALPEVEVHVVANRTRASAERVARQWGVPVVASDWREVVASPAVDAVCIGTWPYLHAEVTLAALQAGKHVLTEARMAANLREAQAMWAAHQAHPELVAQIVPAPLSLPFDATVRDFLQAGTLGTLREICVTHANDAFADADTALPWRLDYALSGQNTLTLGIYYEIILRWLEREPTSLVADAQTFTVKRRTAAGELRPVLIPESVSVLARYDDGARLIAHFSAVERGRPRNDIRLHGERGSLRLDLAEGVLWHTPAGQAERPVEIAPERRGEWQVEADFVDSIRHGRPVRLTDFATGVRYMRFTDAVWRSWNEEGQRVELAD